MPPGKKRLNVDFLKKLQELSGITRNRDFAKECGKNPANITNYLNGNTFPVDRVLKDCVRNIFGWEIEIICEIEKIPEKLGKLPITGGVYVLYDSAANVIYIGKAKNFQAEIRQTLNKSTSVGMRLGSKLDNQRPRYRDLTTHLSLYGIENVRLRHNVEALLLRIFINQTHNRNVGKFR